MSEFIATSAEDVIEIIGSRPNKSSTVETMPIAVLKLFSDL
jgi:hypothetical protein